MSTSNEHDSGFVTTVGEDRLYVINHVTLKMIQASSILVSPVWAAVSLIRGRPLTISGLLRITTRNIPVWGALGALVGAGRLWNEPGYAIQDRAFRLRESASQNRVDLWSRITLVAGSTAMVFAPLGFGSVLHRVGGGASLGMALGVVGHFGVLVKDGGVVKVKEEVEGSLPVKVAEKVAGEIKSP